MKKQLQVNQIIFYAPNVTKQIHHDSLWARHIFFTNINCRGYPYEYKEHKLIPNNRKILHKKVLNDK